MKSEIHYKNGKEEGLKTKWYESGKKKGEIHFKNGISERLTVWSESGKTVVEEDLKNKKLARIFHEKEMANPFQAYKIRLNANSKKGIRRDRLYTHPTRFPRFQTS